MNKEIISERITKALRDSGMKQRELAQKANITESSVSHYVNGRFAPSPEIGERLAKILKVNVGWLLGLDEAEQQGKFYLAQKYFHETDAIEALFAASGWVCEDIVGDNELVDYTDKVPPSAVIWKTACKMAVFPCLDLQNSLILSGILEPSQVSQSVAECH